MTSLRQTAKRVLPRRAQLSILRSIQTGKSLRPVSVSFPSASSAPRVDRFPFSIDHDNPLERLGDTYLPTKRQHNYLVYYWAHLRDIRNDTRNVLEIGLQTDKSIRMWEAFFPNATIYGIDIDPRCKEFEGGRRKVFIGDQSDKVFLREVVSAASSPFDVIIDDGSHRVEHQIASFDFLFPMLSEHGIYVIEDTGGAVGDYRLRTVGALKKMVDHIMYWPKGYDPGDWPQLSVFSDDASWADKNVVGIAFYRWIVFVMRGKNPEDNPYLGGPDRSSHYSTLDGVREEE